VLGASNYSSVRSRAQDAFGPAGNKVADLFSNPKGGSIEQLRSIESELAVQRQQLQRQIDTGDKSVDLQKKIDLIDAVIKLMDDRFGGLLSRIRQGELSVETLGAQRRVATIQGQPRFSEIEQNIGKYTSVQSENLRNLLDRRNDSGAIEDFRIAQRSASSAATVLNEQVEQLARKLKEQGFADKDVETALKPLRDKAAELRSLVIGDLSKQTDLFIEAQRKVISQNQKTITHELSELEKRASQARAPAELQSIFDQISGKRGEQNALSTQDIELQFAKDKDFNERQQRLDALKRDTAAELKKTTEDFAAKNRSLISKAFGDMVGELDAQIKAIAKQMDEIRNQIRDQHLTGAAFDAKQGQLNALRDKSAGLEQQKSQINVQRENLDRSYSVEGADSKQAALIRAAQELGINPRDLANVIGYETGGTFSPSTKNKYGYTGLIQFGAEERAKYGANENQTFEEQMGAVVRYLRDRGLKPGSDIDSLYKTIIGGNPNASLKARDVNGTIEEHLQRVKTTGYERADKFLAGTSATPADRTEAARQAGLDASRKKAAEDDVDLLIKNLDRQIAAKTSTAEKSVSSTLSQAGKLHPDQILDTTIPRIRQTFDDLQNVTEATLKEEISRRQKLGLSTADLEEKLQKTQEDIGSKRQAALATARQKFEEAAHKELDVPVKEAEKRLAQLQNAGETVDQDRIIKAQLAVAEARRQRAAAEVDVQRRVVGFTQDDQGSANTRGQSQNATQIAAIEKQLNEVTQQRIALEQSGIGTDQDMLALKEREKQLAGELADAKQRERDGSREQQDAANNSTAAQQKLAEAGNLAAASLKATASSAGQLAQSGVNSFLRQNNVIDKDGNQLSGFQSLAKETQSILSSISSKFADTFTQIITGTAKGANAWKKMLASMLTDLTKMLAQKAFSFLIGGLFGGTGAAGGILGSLFGSSGVTKREGGIIPGIKRYAQGVITRDSVPALLQPGEAVLNRSAVSMVGEDGLRDMNRLGNTKRSEGNIQPIVFPKQEPQPLNFWVVQRDQVPQPSPSDYVLAVNDDILRGGATKSLIRSVAAGQI
jgi:hypothetical protein